MEISKYIYLATTEGCEACRIMEKILKQVKRDNSYTFSIQVRDYKLIPEFIQVNVILTDFPTLIFLENNVIKYYVELGGCDAIVFTAGIGENSIHTRREVIDGLAALGVKIDEEANECRGVERLITTEDSSIPCYVIPTNEELMIARDTYMLYQEKEKEKELIENEII